MEAWVCWLSATAHHALPPHAPSWRMIGESRPSSKGDAEGDGVGHATAKSDIYTDSTCTDARASACEVVNDAVEQQRNACCFVGTSVFLTHHSTCMAVRYGCNPPSAGDVPGNSEYGLMVCLQVPAGGHLKAWPDYGRHLCAHCERRQCSIVGDCTKPR